MRRCFPWLPCLSAMQCRHSLHDASLPPSRPPALPPSPPCVQLLVEVVQQLQRMFTPDVKVIKRAIDSLIEVRAHMGGGPWGGPGLQLYACALCGTATATALHCTAQLARHTRLVQTLHAAQCLPARLPACSATTWSGTPTTSSCTSTWREEQLRSCAVSWAAQELTCFMKPALPGWRQRGLAAPSAPPMPAHSCPPFSRLFARIPPRLSASAPLFLCRLAVLCCSTPLAAPSLSVSLCCHPRSHCPPPLQPWVVEELAHGTL
jgi:hypothetical protein